MLINGSGLKYAGNLEDDGVEFVFVGEVDSWWFKLGLSWDSSSGRGGYEGSADCPPCTPTFGFSVIICGDILVGLITL